MRCSQFALHNIFCSHFGLTLKSHGSCSAVSWTSCSLPSDANVNELKWSHEVRAQDNFTDSISTPSWVTEEPGNSSLPASQAGSWDLFLLPFNKPCFCFWAPVLFLTKGSAKIPFVGNLWVSCYITPTKLKEAQSSLPPTSLCLSPSEVFFTSF